MAWEKFTLEEQRLQFLEAYINKDASMTPPYVIDLV